MKELTLKHTCDKDGHLFRSYEWDSVPGWEERLSKKLIPVIKQLYIDCDELKSNLEDLGLNGEQIKEFIEQSIKATIPNPVTDNRPPQFKIPRADFAEILATICLEELHSTQIPVKNIFHRELTNAPGRGVDVLGYEEINGNLALIICEVKGSQDAKSPPPCVEPDEDSLKSQLYSYIIDQQKTLNRILVIQKKASINHKLKLTKIALLWGQKKFDSLKIVVCPFLVRNTNYYKDTDFGCFKTNPNYFNPAKVRFLIVCIKSDLNKISNMVFEKALA